MIQRQRHLFWAVGYCVATLREAWIHNTTWTIIGAVITVIAFREGGVEQAARNAKTYCEEWAYNLTAGIRRPR